MFFFDWVSVRRKSHDTQKLPFSYLLPYFSLFCLSLGILCLIKDWVVCSRPRVWPSVFYYNKRRAIFLLFSFYYHLHFQLQGVVFHFSAFACAALPGRKNQEKLGESRKRNRDCGGEVLTLKQSNTVSPLFGCRVAVVTRYCLSRVFFWFRSQSYNQTLDSNKDTATAIQGGRKTGCLVSIMYTK